MALQNRASVVEEFIESQDRGKLFLRSWHPARARAMVAIVHEPGSDGARYWSFAESLAARGIASYVIDLRGWGRSPGPHKRILPIHAHRLDVQAMMSHARSRDPAMPLFILGHGAGALVACAHALEHQNELDGVICEGIVLSEPWKVMVLRALRWIVRPARLLAVPGRFGFGEFRRDALVELHLPLLLLHGSHDMTAAQSGSEYVHKFASSRDKTLQVFEGYDHDLINAPDHALVRDKTCQWIEAQLDSGSFRRRIGVEYIND